MENNKTELINEVLQKIKASKDSIKINGVNFNQDKNEKYNQVKALCKKLFDTNTTDKNITIEEPTKEMPFAHIAVNMTSFGFNEKNKNELIELIGMADEGVFMGEDNNTLSLIFYVNDIWTE